MRARARVRMHLLRFMLHIEQCLYQQQSEVRLLAGTDSGCFFLVSLFAASSEPAKKIFLQARREAGGRIEGEG